MLLVRFCRLDGFADGLKVSAVLDRERLEAECRHALFNIFSEGEVGVAFDGNVIAVVEYDELVECKCSRK